MTDGPAFPNGRHWDQERLACLRQELSFLMRTIDSLRTELAPLIEGNGVRMKLRRWQRRKISESLRARESEYADLKSRFDEELTDIEQRQGLGSYPRIDWEASLLGPLPTDGRYIRAQLAGCFSQAHREAWFENYYRNGSDPRTSWMQAMCSGTVPGPDVSPQLLAMVGPLARPMPNDLVALRTLQLPAPDSAEGRYARSKLSWSIGETHELPAGSSMSVAKPHWLGQDVLLVVDGIATAMPMVGRSHDLPYSEEILTTTPVKFRVTHAVRDFRCSVGSDPKTFELAFRGRCI